MDSLGAAFSNVGSNLAQFGGALGSDLGGLLSTPAAAATASSPASLGAQAEISPPAAGSPDVQAADAGGVQSTDQSQQQPQPRSQGQGQNQQQYAPQSAVKALQKALETLIKQQAAQGQTSKGQWTPTTAVGGQGQPAPSPVQALQAQLGGNLPTPDQFAGGAQDQFGGLPPPDQIGAARLATVNPGYGGIGADVNADPNANMANMVAPGAQPPPQPSPRVIGDPGETRIPPGEATRTTVGGQPTPKTDDQGRQITVQPKGTGAGPETAAAPDTPADTAQIKGQPQPQAGGPPPPRLPPALAGQGGTSPMLPLLALAAIALGATAAAGGFGGRHGRRGRGGFDHHPGGRGHWPYHHPQQGWQFHDWHHGHPWKPMDPRHMQQLPWFRNPRNWWSAGRGTPNPYPPGWELLLAGLLGDRLLSGGGQQGQQGQQGGGQQGVYPAGMWQGGGGQQGGEQPGGQGGDYVKSGNPFTDALTSIESPNGNVVSGIDRDSQGRTLAGGGNRDEISQGFFQIQNYRRGGTWAHYAQLAGVDLTQHPSPMQADYATQHRVARMIPFREWGAETKAQMHARFKTFPDSWTLGQIEDWAAAKYGTAAGSEAAGIAAPKGPAPGATQVDTGAYQPSPLG